MGNLAAYILAGGQSSRMGKDKAFIPFQGRSLIDLAREKALAVTFEVHVVGPKEKFGAAAIEDVYPGHGPLAGIHAALLNSRRELNLVLAVDLPNINVEFLKHLVHETEQSSAVVVVPRTSDGWQPLCAIYRSAFLSTAEAALKAGRNKIDALFNQVQLRIIDQEEIVQAGFDLKMFDNLNTPEDLQRAQPKS